MPTLHITLLGPPQLHLDGTPLVLTPRNSARARALLYYLAATARPATRERLAGLLWSDSPDKKAREYLRGELFLLGPLKDTFWVETSGQLALRPETCTVDLAHFYGATSAATATPEALEEALRLWQGTFLDGIERSIERSAALYLEWVEETRVALETLYDQTLYRLAESCARTRRSLAAGLDACTRLLARSPEREEVHRLKMHLLALDGQRSAALRQYDLCTAALLDELGILPSSDTTALYDQIVAGDVGPAAVATPIAAAPPFQAPAPPAHFFGRYPALEGLTAWLSQPQAGTVAAIVGMGGIGKTALAAVAAETLRPHFPDGVLWARVATDDPLDILQSWALAFDKDFSKIGSLDARAAAMRTLLAGRRTLIVLDDLVAGRPVTSLLPGAPGCPVLITTRARAEVAAYTTQLLDLQELAPADGLAMLASFLGTERVAAEEAAAAALCDTLGGLPLALEIAAQRIFASPRPNLARMVRSLEDAGTRLAQGTSNRSVRTSLAVSWDALPARLRTVFACTGLFDGRTFAPPAVAAIAGIDNEQVTDALDHLVTLSMLKTDGDERYIHHRLLADFAAETAASLLAPGARLQLAAYYAHLARQAAADYDRLEAEWDNLTASLAAAHEATAWPLVIAMVDALTAPWFARARFPHARRGFAWGLAAAEALGDETRHARYAYFLGKILLRQDEYAAARRLLDEAIQRFDAAANRPRLADAYVDLADVAFEEEKNAEAATLLAGALAIYIELRQPVGMAAVRSRQGLLAVYAGDFDEARRLCEAGLAQLPTGEGAVVRSRTLRLLSDIALLQAQVAEAADFRRQAEAVNQQVNDPTETAALLFAQAKLDHHLGFPEEALTSAQRSAERYAAMGDRKASAIVYHLISRIHLTRRAPAAAREAASHALAIAQALADPGLLDLCRQQLAAVDAFESAVE